MPLHCDGQRRHCGVLHTFAMASLRRCRAAGSLSALREASGMIQPCGCKNVSDAQCCQHGDTKSGQAEHARTSLSPLRAPPPLARPPRCEHWPWPRRCSRQRRRSYGRAWRLQRKRSDVQWQWVRTQGAQGSLRRTKRRKKARCLGSGRRPSIRIFHQARSKTRQLWSACEAKMRGFRV